LAYGVKTAVYQIGPAMTSLHSSVIRWIARQNLPYTESSPIAGWFSVQFDPALPNDYVEALKTLHRESW